MVKILKFKNFNAIMLFGGEGYGVNVAWEYNHKFLNIHEILSKVK